MKTYEVTIEARITKTYTVSAENEDQAYENAHEIFSVLTDDAKEYYEQETMSVTEVSPYRSKFTTA